MTRRRLAALGVVLVAIGLAASWFLDETTGPFVQVVREHDTTPRTAPAPAAPDTTAEQLVELDAIPNTHVAEAPAPAAVAPWSVRWTLVNEHGQPLPLTALLNAGVLASVHWRGTLTTVGANGRSIEERLELTADVILQGDLETTLPPPVDVTLEIGHVAFEGVAKSTQPTVALRANGPLIKAGTSLVTFESNVILMIVSTVDSDRLTTLIATPTRPQGSPTAHLLPGRYEYAATAPYGDRANGTFTVVQGEPLVVHVTFPGPTTFSGELHPPPRDDELVTVLGRNDATPWLSLIRTNVASDGSFEFEQVQPGLYSFVIERRKGADTILAPALSTHAIVAGANTGTIVDADRGDRGVLTVRATERTSLLIHDARGNLHAMTVIDENSGRRLLLARDRYTYSAGSGAGTLPTRLTGTFAIGTEPVEIDLRAD